MIGRGRSLHFRIFDHTGKMVKDVAEGKLKGQASRIKSLKDDLTGLWPPATPTTNECDNIISKCMSMLGYSLGYVWPDGKVSPHLSEWVEYSYVTEAGEHAQQAVHDGWLMAWMLSNHPDEAKVLGPVYDLDRLRDRIATKVRPTEAVLLARYKENCDQARQHETIRERTTAMVAQTTGVMLGLTVLKGGEGANESATPYVAMFIIVLGVWGGLSSIQFARLAATHREQINRIRAQLQLSFTPTYKRGKSSFPWIAFHMIIMTLGIALLVLPEKKAGKGTTHLVIESRGDIQVLLPLEVGRPGENPPNSGKRPIESDARP